MELEGSLPQSQEPAACLCPEPHRSNPWPPSHILELQLNICFPSTPGSAKWPLFLRFPYQNSLYTSPFPHTSYMPYPSRSSQFDETNSTGWAVRSLNSTFCGFLHSPVTSFLLGPNMPLNTPFSDTLSLHSSLIVSDQISHPCSKYIERNLKVAGSYVITVCQRC